MTERWRAIPGLEGYEASTEGRIRSLRRGEPYVMKATPGPCGCVRRARAGRQARHLPEA